MRKSVHIEKMISFLAVYLVFIFEGEMTILGELYCSYIL